MTVFGIDTSHFDGTISLATARKMVSEGIQFATAKISEGTGYDDPLDGTNLRNFRDAGIKVIGGYHVVRTSGTVKAQVDYHLELLDRDEPWWRDFPGFFHQVDLELWGYDNVSAARGMDYGKALEDASQKIVVMYASKGQYGNQLTAWKPRPLWNANYPVQANVGFKELYAKCGGDNGAGWVEYSNQMPAIWQYGSTATIGGMTTCDANAYRGTFDQLYALITGGTMTYPTAAEIENKNWHTAGSTGIPDESAGTTLYRAAKEATDASDKADQILAALKASTGDIGVITIDVDTLRQIIGEEVTKALLAHPLTSPNYTLTWTQ